MADRNDEAAASLSPGARKFVVHWGELGTRWGINRTVAQVHALLFVSQRPLDVQAITDALGVARSNASTSVRELLAWGLVRPVHILGDRREHYEAIGDVWQILTIIAEQRKRREIDPTLAILRECEAEMRSASTPNERFVANRVRAMLELFETLSPLVDEFAALPAATIRALSGLRGKVRNVFKVRR
ncbi:MAG: MarR family transcriptional regulator [bacterium]|nr:MarR family transcriptional regulator [bacterium]